MKICFLLLTLVMVEFIINNGQGIITLNFFMSLQDKKIDVKNGMQYYYHHQIKQIV